MPPYVQAKQRWEEDKKGMDMLPWGGRRLRRGSGRAFPTHPLRAGVGTVRSIWERLRIPPWVRPSSDSPLQITATADLCLFTSLRASTEMKETGNTNTIRTRVTWRSATVMDRIQKMPVNAPRGI